MTTAAVYDDVKESANTPPTGMSVGKLRHETINDSAHSAVVVELEREDGTYRQIDITAITRFASKQPDRPRVVVIRVRE